MKFVDIKLIARDENVTGHYLYGLTEDGKIFRQYFRNNPAYKILDEWVEIKSPKE